jgi:hypothetical protein
VSNAGMALWIGNKMSNGLPYSSKSDPLFWEELEIFDNEGVYIEIYFRVVLKDSPTGAGVRVVGFGIC